MPALCQGGGKPCTWPSESSLITTETGVGKSTEWLTHMGCRVPRHSLRFAGINFSLLHNTPLRSALLLPCPFSRKGKGDTERETHLLKSTQLNPQGKTLHWNLTTWLSRTPSLPPGPSCPFARSLGKDTVGQLSPEIPSPHPADEGSRA